MRRTIALLIAMTFGLAACSAGAGGSSEPEMGQGLTGDGAPAGGEELGGQDTAVAPISVDLDVTQGRQVIRRASLQLHATDTRAAFDEILGMAQAVGGFVADANVFPTTSEDAQPQVTMTLRVPAERLDETLDAIKGSVDEVVSETQGAQDVTEEFIDLEARLTNLEALETELRALLEETRLREDAEPDDVLRVFNEVSSVRGQIEQLHGHLNYLGDLTALATVELGITQTPSTAPLVAQPWSPGETVRDAASNLVAGLQGIADWLINFGLFALPMLLLVVGPLAVLGVFVYRRFFRGPQSTAPVGS